MKRLCQLFALCGLLVVAGEALAASEQAAARNGAAAKLLEQGKADAAIAEFQNALAIDPTYFPARLNLAFAYERAGKVEDAIAAYQGAIAVQPRNFLAHNNLGVLYDKKGQYDLAIGEFESALAVQPGEPMAAKNLATAKKNEATIRERQVLILKAEHEAQTKPDDPRASYNLARIHAAYGNSELALQWLGKAVKQGYKNLDDFKADPAFASLREEREFQLLLLKK